MKRSFFFLLSILLFTLSAFAKADSLSIPRAYERGMNLAEGKTDSIRYFADYINRAMLRQGYPKGKIMSLRLYGYYFENKGDYKQAIDYYLQALNEARRLNDVEFQAHAMTDLAIVYTEDMKQPGKAKELYLECVKLNKAAGNAHSLISSYINLGAIYNHLGLYDSALVFLTEGFRIGKPLESRGEENLSSLYNNFGNSYFFKKDYDQALRYFRLNYTHDLDSNNQSEKASDLWYDTRNIAEVYIEKGGYDSAYRFVNTSLDIALKVGSRRKQLDSYEILAKLYQRKGEYRKAFDYQRKWYELDTALVNSETYKAIAELEEKSEARQRENENLLLAGEITQQKFHNRIIMMTAISMLVIAIIAGMAFVVKRRVNRQLQATNDLVVRQNERLSELNYEKNSLISIVSHDLSTPFASIGMWTRLLQTDEGSLSADQSKALRRIEQATAYGENLIRHILDVEKAETNQHKVQLENLDLRIFTETVVDEFQHAAVKKNINLHLDCPARSIYFLSDRQLLSRMLENLLSNAIKYTGPGKNVWMSVSEEKDSISIRVRDEGVGIEPDELPHLFSKYSKISTQPTNGESSTGLGLSIVKRICEELNGQISCESTPGQGSIFTVILKK